MKTTQNSADVARHVIFSRVHVGFSRRHVIIWRDHVVFHITIGEDEIHRHVALPVILPLMCRRRGTHVAQFSASQNHVETSVTTGHVHMFLGMSPFVFTVFRMFARLDDILDDVHVFFETSLETSPKTRVSSSAR